MLLVKVNAKAAAAFVWPQNISRISSFGQLLNVSSKTRGSKILSNPRSLKILLPKLLKLVILVKFQGF